MAVVEETSTVRTDDSTQDDGSGSAQAAAQAPTPAPATTAQPAASTTVVPYAPVQTRLQRRDNANELQLRLDLITQDIAEDILGRLSLDDGNEQTVLQMLQRPAGDKAIHEVVTGIFSSLAQRSEGLSEAIAALFRYVQMHRLWEGHPNPAVKSAAQLVRTLASFDVLEVNIAVGAATMENKRAYIKTIEQHWGADWHSTVLRRLPDPDWQQPAFGSRAKLKAIAGNAVRGLSLSAAIAGWQQAMRIRCDERLRREHNVRGSTRKLLALQDILAANTAPRDVQATEQEAALHQVQVRGMPRLLLDSLPLHPLPSASASSSPAPNSAGNRQRKRKAAAAPSAPARASTRQKKADLPRAAPGHRWCEGPALAEALTSVLALLEDKTHMEPTIPERLLDCCSECKTPAGRAWAMLHGPLQTYLTELRGVKRHVMGQQLVKAWPANTPLLGRGNVASSSGEGSDASDGSETEDDTDST